MPRIPGFNETQVQDRQAGGGQLSSPSSPDLFGGAQAKQQLALGRSLGEVQGFLAIRKNKNDIASLMEAETAFKALQLEKGQEFLNTKGKNSIGVTGLADDFFERNGEPQELPDFDGISVQDVGEFEEEIPERAPTETAERYQSIYRNLPDDLKPVFDQWRNGQRAAFVNQIGKHEDSERNILMVNTYKVNKESTINMAAQFPYDDEGNARRIKELRNRDVTIGDSLGWTREMVKAEKESGESAIHAGVIQARLNVKDITGAKDYFDKHGHKLLGDSRKKIEGLIAQKTLLGNVQETADRISDLIPAEREKAIRKIKDPSLRKGVEDQLSQNDVIRNRARQAQNKADVDTVDKLLTSGTITEISGTDEWERLTPAQKQGFRARERSQGKIVVPDQMDAETSQELNDMITSSDPDIRQKFVDMNIAVENINALNPGSIKTFQAIQRGMRNNKGEAKKSLITLKSNMDAKFKAIGWVGNDFARQRNVLTNQIQEEILAMEGKGVEPTQNQVNDIILKALTPLNINTLNKRFEDPDAIEPATGTFTVKQHVDTFLKTHDLSRKDDAEKVGKLEAELQRRIISIKDRTGKDVPDHTIVEMIDTIGTDTVTVEDAGFGVIDRDKLLTELSDEEVKDAYVNALGKEVRLTEILEIPDKDRLRMAQELRQAGKRPTMQSLAELHVLETANKSRPPARKVEVLTSADGKKEVNIREFIGNMRQRPFKALKSQRDSIAKFWGARGEKIVDQVLAEKVAIGEGDTSVGTPDYTVQVERSIEPAPQPKEPEVKEPEVKEPEVKAPEVKAPDKPKRAQPSPLSKKDSETIRKASTRQLEDTKFKLLSELKPGDSSTKARREVIDAIETELDRRANGLSFKTKAVALKSVQKLVDDFKPRISKVKGLKQKDAVEIFTALVETESAFKPNAKSNKGALGLAQIMPATAELIAKKSGLGLTKDQILHDPEANVKAGMWLLFEEAFPKYADTDDQLGFALAEYNAGRPKVRSAQDKVENKFGEKARSEFRKVFEFLPKETQGYIKRNQANRLQKG